MTDYQKSSCLLHTPRSKAFLGAVCFFFKLLLGQNVYCVVLEKFAYAFCWLVECFGSWYVINIHLVMFFF